MVTLLFLGPRFPRVVLGFVHPVFSCRGSRTRRACAAGLDSMNLEETSNLCLRIAGLVSWTMNGIDRSHVNLGVQIWKLSRGEHLGLGTASAFCIMYACFPFPRQWLKHVRERERETVPVRSWAPYACLCLHSRRRTALHVTATVLVPAGSCPRLTSIHHSMSATGSMGDATCSCSADRSGFTQLDRRSWCGYFPSDWRLLCG